MRESDRDHGEIGGARNAGLAGLEAAAAVAASAPAVVLLLHGGRAVSYEPVSRGNLAAARMRVLGASVRRGGRALPVLTLRYRVRGWNDEGGARVPDPVRDAQGALEVLQDRLGPIPVILIGHSLGGRTAVRVAGHPSVRAVAALAPWLPPGEPVETLEGRTVLIAHGCRDKVTDPKNSIAFAQRAAAVADTVYLKILDDGHAMLRAPGAWHRLVADFAAVAAFGPAAASVDAERVAAP